ncbi:MAG: endospore germination permease [Defluviitaleaceae bacterium]|nr:endospore germination permease [Defluviitaleaceae bacterium]
MSSNKKITMRQLQILIILSAMGTGVIVLPRRAAEFLPAGAQDGWIIAVGLTLAAMLAGALISIAARTAQKAAEDAGAEENPGFIASMEVLLGKPVAYAIGVAMWVKLVIAAGLELRIFLEISRDVMLPNTPMFVVGGVMLAVCAYAAAKGFEVRARVAEVLFALMMLPFLFLFVVSVMDADFSNLRPAFENDVRALIYGSLRLGFILTGLECLLLVSPYVPREKSLVRAVVGGISVAGVLIIGITIVTIASFGRGVASEPWPVISMMDVISLPGSFIERQEALMFGFWIITAFALANALLFFGGLLLRDMYKKAKLGGGVLLTTIAVFAVSLLPMSRENVFSKIDFLYLTTGAFFIIVLPLILIIAAKITRWGTKMLVLVLLLVAFTGCWDRVEIENRAFVVAMGVDRQEESYVVTLSIPIIGEEGENPEGHITKESGKTVTEAIKKLDAKNDKSLYFGQTKLVIIGTSLLEKPEKLTPAIASLDNILKAKRRIHVLAAKDPTDILEAKPPGEVLPGAYLSDIYRDKEKIGGTALTLDFDRFSANPNAIIPKVERDDDELLLKGAGNLTPEQLRGYLWCFQNGNQGGTVTTQCASGAYATLKVKSHEAKVDIQKNNLRMIIEVTASGKVNEPIENPKAAFEAAIAKEIMTVEEFLKNTYRVDKIIPRINVIVL